MKKLLIFCSNCGLLGHWYEECGTSEHDNTKFEWSDFILADGGRSRTGYGGGRGNGNDMSAGRGRGGMAFGRGFGRGANRDDFWEGNTIESKSYDGQESWSWNVACAIRNRLGMRMKE